jgi:hypothetical protein
MAYLLLSIGKLDKNGPSQSDSRRFRSTMEIASATAFGARGDSLPPIGKLERST